jgi:hypothetical protein
MQELHMDEDRQWVGLGDAVEVTPERQKLADARATKDLEYAEKAEVHLWAVILSHRASDPMLDAFDGASSDLPMLDAETLLMQPAICCMVCERPSSPRCRRSRRRRPR